MNHDKVRHCTHQTIGTEKTATSCSDWV
jgi:hypothetical protein